MHKKNWMVLTVTIFTLAAIAFIGLKFAIEDYYEYYDDFNLAVLDESKWSNLGDPAVVNFHDGKLIVHGQDCHLGGNTIGKIQSTRLWTNEDIKIVFKASWRVQEGTDSGSFCTYVPKIYYGSVAIPIEDVRVLVEDTSQYNTYDAHGVIEIVRYSDFDPSAYKVILNGQEVGSGNQSSGVPLVFEGGRLEIDSVRFLPYYSCNIDYNTEVVVRDRFFNGSSVNVQAFTYSPTKFCPQDLGVLIFNEEGFTDEKGSITKALANGQTLVVDDAYWQIDYVTKYVDSMQERCGLGDVYDTSQNKCVSVAVQQVTDSTLLYCEADSDCLIPSKCKPSTSVQCVNNQCDYASTVCTPEQIINEILVQKTLHSEKPEIIKMSDTPDTFTFSADMSIAGREFISTMPKVLCDAGTESGYIRGSGCYETDVTWGIYEFSIKNGAIKDLGEMTVYYEMTGPGAFNGQMSGQNYTNEFVSDDDWENTFTITFNDVIHIEQFIYGKAVGKDSDAKLEIKFKNNLGWELDNAGYSIRNKKLLTDVQGDYNDKQVKFTEGDNNLSIDLDTSDYGGYLSEIVLFFKLSDTKKHQDSEKILFGYNVVDSSDAATIASDEPVCEGEGCEDDKKNDVLFIVGGLGAFGLIFAAWWYFRR